MAEEGTTEASTGTVIVSKTEGVADTAYGKVRGFIDEGTYTFRGIPYAKAERFGMPEAPDAWDDVLNCLVYGATAPITKVTEPYGGDFLIPHRYWAQNENCQNLNIWTQSLDTEAKKPVMVWFHGGGFTNGSAIEGVAYDGRNLSEYGDVVVVTVNHRLNVLGYLNQCANRGNVPGHESGGHQGERGAENRFPLLCQLQNQLVDLCLGSHISFGRFHAGIDQRFCGGDF